MNSPILFNLKKYLPAALLAFLLVACERDLEELKPAAFPTNPEVFIDGFSAGLNYAVFGGASPSAFDVDNQVTWNNSSASMRFDVPNAGDPSGAYAGGVFFTSTARDLSGYNALTFYAKASQSATIGLIGFGNDMGPSTYQVSISDLQLSTGWKKFIIPLPDPSRLTAERGMFIYSAGPVDGKGFTFWVDELKFEQLGTIAHPHFTILNGQEQVETSFTGVSKTIGGLSGIYNLPSGVNQTISLSPAYFQFLSSDPSIATVDASGKVLIAGGPGNAVITAKVGEVTADGSFTVQSQGVYQHAPTSSQDADKVISIFSDAYANIPVNYYNGYWAPYQTTLSADFDVNGDHVLNYTDFNFVGIEFSSPTVDATSMTHLHVDLFIPNALAATGQIRLELVDLVANVTGTSTRSITPAQTQQWLSLDIPLASFSGLSKRTNLGQLIFVDVNNNISGFYADNIYFYNASTAPAAPTTQAPVPTHPAANVISVYSDAYSSITGTDMNPNWGQATAVSVVQVQGNNTLKYAGLNYQGIQLGSSQNVSAMAYLHLDYWSATSTSLKVFLISPGPVETAYTLQVPTTGWRSLDIPLSSFAPVNMSDVIQLKFEGNGDIFLDNIYFRKN
ncbi:MAG: glycosyl hydrolase family 16 [Bacteroidales bacterium]|nr:glycosyl hydrolase family 16 [Bacteroidales bacterium]